MKRTRRVVAGVLIIFSLSFLQGCWSRKEIEDLAVVTMIGLDRITEQGVDKWRYTARIMQPKAGQGGQGGNQQSNGAPQGGKELLLTGTGLTMQEAARNTGLRSPRYIFMSFVSTIVVGERAAREGVSEIAEIRGRYRDFRPRTYIAVTNGEAFDVLQSCPEVSDTLYEEIEGLADHKAERIGVACSMDWNYFVQNLLGPDRDAVAPRITTVQPKEDPANGVRQAAFLQGNAVFRGDKLAGWLNEEETLGYILAVGDLNNAIIPITLVEGDKRVAYLVGRFRSTIEPVVGAGKVSFRLKVKTWGEVDETHNIRVNDDSLQWVEAAAADKIRGVVLKAIDKTKELNADVIGFSQELHRTNLEAWGDYRPAWRDNFRKAEIEVEVECKVTRTGRLGKGEAFKD